MSRPPYLRWALAAVILVTGVALELRPATTVRHPFTIAPVAVGETIDESVVVWRDVPHGLFDPVVLPVSASRFLGAAEPVLAGEGTESDSSGIPTGWWAIELPVPLGARPGSPVKLITHGTSTEGVVVETRDGDFGERTGLVAVPAGSADAVAAASLDTTVAVLIGG